MEPLQKFFEIQRLRWREAEQNTPPLTSPNFVQREIPNPDAEIRRLGGHGHLLLALAQIVGQLRRA